MKKLLILSALLLTIAASSPAQLVQEDTPNLASAFEWKQASDGSSLIVLEAWTLHEAYFAVPFGMDFSAGHGVWLGTRTRLDQPIEAEGVFGYEVFARKNVGGTIGSAQLFIKASAGFAIGPRTPDNHALSGYVALSAGIGF